MNKSTSQKLSRSYSTAPTLVIRPRRGRCTNAGRICSSRSSSPRATRKKNSACPSRLYAIATTRPRLNLKSVSLTSSSSRRWASWATWSIASSSRYSPTNNLEHLNRTLATRLPTRSQCKFKTKKIRTNNNLNSLFSIFTEYLKETIN